MAQMTQIWRLHMLRPLLAVLLFAAVLAPSPAFAAICDYGDKFLSLAGGTVYATASCADGSEDAPTAVTHGMALTKDGKRIKAVTVHVECDSAMLTTGSFDAYIWVPMANGGSGQWHRAPQFDITPTNINDETYTTFFVGGWFKNSRVHWNPNGIGAAVKIFLTVTM